MVWSCSCILFSLKFCFVFFFFKQKTAYEMRISDWSSDVCSSDLKVRRARAEGCHRHGRAAGEPAVDVGHERGALLVPGRDVPDAARPGEGIEDVERLDRKSVV